MKVPCSVDTPKYDYLLIGARKMRGGEKANGAAIMMTPSAIVMRFLLRGTHNSLQQYEAASLNERLP